MGNYLNSQAPYEAYRKEFDSPYFVDKTLLLEELFSIIGTSINYVCLTRPRRFGKSVMANMIASFFSKACPARKVFDKLKIANHKHYEKYIGQYDVISITLNELPRKCTSYTQYIDRIENRLIKDLMREYPEADICAEDAVWDALMSVFNTYHSKQFIFVLDEWDFIFHRDFVSEKDKKEYISFLSNLLKDKPYVALAYMTGILPIAKYSSGSELNMFLEYTMATKVRYSEFFGFTEEEVDALYKIYQRNTIHPRIDREGLRFWYDGYHTPAKIQIYNPRSVVSALSDNQLSNYWTSAGPYDEIYYYINHNIAAVREDLAQMIAGVPVQAKVQEYAATSMNLTTKDEIFSAMVVYGFLSYENGYVSIPNRELMEKFSDMLIKEASLGYIHQLAAKSSETLQATLRGDSDKVAEVLKYAHDTEIPLLAYNSESELTTLVTLAYLSARDSYRIEREEKAGEGFVDFIFYPEINRNDDAIILELKVDHTAEEALQQIKDRQYALKFEGKLGEIPKYTGRVLGVGIAYDRKTKDHTCKIEVLREKLAKS
jgi:hypothetical protein